MKWKEAILCIVCIGAVILIAGCAAPEDGATPTPTPIPTTPQPTSTPDFSTNPTPTDVVPDFKSVTVTTLRDPIFTTIAVRFDGGKGQAALIALDVTAYLADGRIVQEKLGLKKGDEIEIEGTKGTDRIVVHATFNDGTKYKIYDEALEFKKRQN